MAVLEMLVRHPFSGGQDVVGGVEDRRRVHAPLDGGAPGPHERRREVRHSHHRRQHGHHAARSRPVSSCRVEVRTGQVGEGGCVGRGVAW
eukprot:2438048-Pyramimonas_sp.AAC.1